LNELAESSSTTIIFTIAITTLPQQYLSITKTSSNHLTQFYQPQTSTIIHLH
jgi:hypothetical protein